MRTAHHVERIGRCDGVDQGDQIGGLGRCERVDLGRESLPGLVGQPCSQPRNAVDHGFVIERSGPGDEDQASRCRGQRDARPDVGPHPLGATPCRVVDDEQVGETQVELVESLALQVGEAVEVPEDRRDRHPRPVGDVVGGRRDLAVVHEREHRVDDGAAASLTPCAAAVGGRLRCH